MTAPTLTINSLDLDVAGFCRARNLTGLLTPAPMRNEPDFIADGVDGAEFTPKARGSLETGISLLVYGANDETGTPHSDEWVGLRDNIETIEAALVSPTALVTATVTYGDASTRSGQIYVPSIRPGDIVDGDATGFGKILVVEIVCPAGGLS